MPLISVIMSVYNGQAYLAEAVDSVLAQTLGDFEFIIIDDGSTDGSIALLNDYAKRDSRIRFTSRPNKGLTATLNEALRASHGKYIARMDPDDVSLPHRFEKQVAFLEQHPDVVCLGSRVLMIDPYGTPLRETNQPLDHNDLDRDLLQGLGWSIVHPVAMMRRDTLEAVGGYNEKYRTSQDMELWLRLAEVGKLANQPEILLKYRQHLESANFAKAEQQKKLKVQILSEAYDRRGIGPFDPASLQPPPISDPFQVRKRWGWAALKTRHMQAARAHAWANIKQRPTSMEMWKLLFFAVRGH